LGLKSQQENHLLRDKQTHLQEQARLLLHKRFGAKTEKYSAGQSDLFNEAEAYAEDGDGSGSVPQVDDGNSPLADVEAKLAADALALATHSAKRGRKALPTELPRVGIVHELPEGQRHCGEGHTLVVIGEEVSEQLDVIPAKIQVLRHIRKKYACPCCGAGVKTAPLPPQPILPKSNASAGLLAYIVTAKFLDALPLYRQSKQFQRIGVYLPRATLASWTVRCGGLVQALCNLMQEQLGRYPIQQMDETTAQVLKEDGKAATSQSYMWVQRGGPPERPVIRFSYSPSRSQNVGDQSLLDFQGILQTDGYAGYLTPCAKNGLRHAGCWAHVRRKFDEALKAQDPKATSKAGKASEALATIQALYRIEKAINGLPVADRLQIRRQKAKPILNAMKEWLDTSLTQVTPSSLTGKALTYLSNQWPSLTVYCEDCRLDIDNNAIERAIRPFVIGRNNWMFSDTVKGVNASANLYSLVETAKLNGLEPYRYLHHVFNELPKAQTLADIERLLPWNVDKDAINQGWKN
jgi:transposase